MAKLDALCVTHSRVMEWHMPSGCVKQVSGTTGVQGAVLVLWIQQGIFRRVYARNSSNVYQVGVLVRGEFHGY
jgi:hypothetical protein